MQSAAGSRRLLAALPATTGTEIDVIVTIKDKKVAEFLASALRNSPETLFPQTVFGATSINEVKVYRGPWWTVAGTWVGIGIGGVAGIGGTKM